MSDLRPSRPLDPDAVQAANQAVWKEFNLPPGTQLTMDSQDEQARKRWMEVYLAAAKKKEKPAPAPQPPPTVMELCSKSCGEMWGEINADTDKITNISDPEERNRKISAAYAQLQKDNPNLKWIGLAAVVSRQAGCAMKYADDTAKQSSDQIQFDQEIMKHPVMPPQRSLAGVGANAGVATNMLIAMKQRDAATTAKEALGVANKGIFHSIYPSIAFYQRHGLAKLKECAYDADGERRVPEKVQKALERLEGGKPEDERAAADMLADYEQREIVEKEVYQVEKYKDVLKDNENWSSGKRLWAGRLFGAKPAQIPLSSTCSGEEIPQKGSILDPDDRVQYYNALMDKYQSNGPDWQKQTMQEIINQGQ